MKRELSHAAAEREAAQKALRNGELKDRDTYTAKQVAYRLGTDAKTLRKFFRSSHSTVEPVGQGGRYEFESSDMPQIKKEFAGWLNRNSLKNRPAQVHLTEQAKIKGGHGEGFGTGLPNDVDYTDTELELVASAIERAQETKFCEGCEATGRELNSKGYCQECIYAAIKSGNMDKVVDTDDSPWEPHPDLADVDIDMLEDLDLDDEEE